MRECMALLRRRRPALARELVEYIMATRVKRNNTLVDGRLHGVLRVRVFSVTIPFIQDYVYAQDECILVVVRDAKTGTVLNRRRHF